MNIGTENINAAINPVIRTDLRLINLSERKTIIGMRNMAALLWPLFSL